jgi:RNA polymerase sigma-70 factor (ECF subfamily)
VNDADANAVDVTRAYERHRAELRSFFTSVARGKAGYIEDLVHNVYLRLLEYPPAQVLREPQAYLFKLAWRELHRFHERALREPQSYDHEALDYLSARNNATAGADSALDESAEALLMRVLGVLPAIYGQVFVRFKWDGRTYRQIASEYNLTPRQVKRYIARTLQCLKQARAEG